MKSIVLNDARTGEALHIEFDLDTNQMTIEGVKVVRTGELEHAEGLLVFGSPEVGPSQVYYLTRAQVNEIRVMWGFDPVK